MLRRGSPIVEAVRSSGQWTAFVAAAALLVDPCIVVGAGAQEPPPKGSGPATPPLRIHCPALDEEAKAALEARARAEMAANPHSAEDIAIDCVDDSALVTKRVEGAAATGWRRVELPPDHALAVDDLLDAVHSLRSEPPGSAVAPDGIASRRPAGNSSYAFGAVVGAGGLLWYGAIEEALGPRVGLRLSAPRHWSMNLVASVVWGLSSASGLRARAYEASWTVHYAPVAWLDAGVGADLFGLAATPSSSGAREQSTFTGGGVAQVRYVLRGGRLSLSLGPQLEVLARPIVVEVAQVEAFHVSNLVAGLVMDAEADLIR